jgi:hypothetical protein
VIFISALAMLMIFYINVQKSKDLNPQEKIGKTVGMHAVGGEGGGSRLAERK